MAVQRPLANAAQAFRNLANTIDNGEGAVRVDAFSNACALITPLITSVGPIFRLAMIDYNAKVNDLLKASTMIATLPELIHADILTNTVETLGSHTRNLLRVKRALEMLKVLFREMLAARDDSMIGPAMTSYSEAFGAYHVADAQNIIALALAAIPTKSWLIRAVNETDNSARYQMEIYVSASARVIDYVNHLYNSNELGIDW